MGVSKSAAAEAYVAFQRFGLGAKPGALERVAAHPGGPRGALIAELDPAAALINVPSLPDYAGACRLGVTPAPMPNDTRKAEVAARFDKHLSAEIGFVERLVLFWSNHFSMHWDKANIVAGTIGQFERDVIRRNVLGKFSDMLSAVYHHPAMIAYLDNDASIGFGSVKGRTGFGYTENLAREILELHTLGTGNYDQSDVIALSNMLTGWSYVNARQADSGLAGGSDANRGQWIYRADWHEPGRQTFLGREIMAIGQGQGEQAIEILAKEPATAANIATKLCRHFIADEPTAAMVDVVRQAFISSGGDLKETAMALVGLDEAFSAPAKKFRMPYEFVVAMFRALGSRYTAEEELGFTRMLRALNQDVWGWLTPDGYPDESAFWLTPHAVAFRIDAAQKTAQVFGRRIAPVDPLTLATKLYGRKLSKRTREKIAHSGGQMAGLTILFASPEFQRR